MTDYLAPLPPARVAGWYSRLAGQIAAQRIDGAEPLASQLLRHWLENRDANSTYSIAAPRHLRESSYVTGQQRYHRAVFLTEQRARLAHGHSAWAGVVPRLQGSLGHTLWNLEQPLDLTYQSLVEVGSSIADIGRIQLSGSPEELDLLTALRGFQLRSSVRVYGTAQRDRQIQIRLADWRCQVSDRYDWDYTEHFTVPNPDHGSSDPAAVRPADQRLTVYHSNAQRLEQAGLAAPYNLLTNPWPVTDIELTRGTVVNPARHL